MMAAVSSNHTPPNISYAQYRGAGIAQAKTYRLHGRFPSNAFFVDDLDDYYWMISWHLSNNLPLLSNKSTE